MIFEEIMVKASKHFQKRQVKFYKRNKLNFADAKAKDH